MSSLGLLVCGGAITVFLTSTAAHAAGISPNCRFYEPGGANLVEVDELFNASQPNAVLLCLHGGGRDQFYTASAATRSRGVCSYVLETAFRFIENGKVLWRPLPPERDERLPSKQVFMMKSDGSCAPSADPSYVMTSGVPEEAFIRVLDFINAAIASASSFAKGSNSDARLTWGFKTLHAEISHSQPLSVEGILSSGGSDQEYKVQIKGPSAIWMVYVDVATSQITGVGNLIH